MTIHVVVGGQYGSEGKGKVTGWLASNSLAPLVIRIGGPNAGHTVIDPGRGGEAFAMRQIPVGFVNPQATLAIGAGSEVEIAVLENELDRLGPSLGKVMVDPSVTILTNLDHESEADLGMRERIGSTAKGIGSARIRRLARTAQTMRDLEAEGWSDDRVAVTDVARLARTFQRHGQDIIIEGTQGYGLGLHGPHYPFCTSGDCTAIDFLAQARVNPWAKSPNEDDLSIWVVCRVFPIRVAGNSGPLKSETSWEDLGLPVELTTVTRLPRRVGLWDQNLVNDAVDANGGGGGNVQIYLSMADQAYPIVAEWDGKIRRSHLPLALLQFITHIEDASGVKVAAIGTGPNTTIEVVS